MSRIYAFGPNDDENDYSTMGLVGTLLASECLYSPVGNGESIVSIKHPIDEFGKYKALLQLGNILVVPVPVRTTPEIQNGSCVTTVWTYKVKPLNQLTSKSQRTLYKKKTGSSAMKVMNAGDSMTIVWQTDEPGVRWRAKTKYGTGWVDSNGIVLVTQHIIADNSQAIEEIQSPWVITPQYFRIYERNVTLGEVQVEARQLYYDLLHNTTRYAVRAATNLQMAVNGVLDECYDTHPFKAYTNVANVSSELLYRLRNPIDAILNPENGLCKKFDVSLVVDNYDLYLLHDPGTNRGVSVKYRRNMLGIKFRSSDDAIATRIIPTGETKDGNNLMLSDSIAGHYVDSSKINLYPVIHSYPLKCTNCTVGDKDENGGEITVAVARARMRQQALDLLVTGCDEPQIELEVEFLKLGDTEEYKQFKNLDNVFLFDYVLVRHPDFDIDVTTRVVGLTWNVLKDRLESIKLGSVGKTLANTGVTTWQIPSGFSGTKIAGETIGSAALKSDIINVRHVQASSINTDALQANSITAIKIAAGAITADKIEAGSVTTEKLSAGSVTTEKLSAGSVTTEKLSAGSVSAEKISANAITAEKIAANTICANKLSAGIITAGSGLIADGAIGRVHIADASITDAKIVGLSASKLSAGTIDASEITVLNLNAANITVGTINGQQISSGAIDTGHLTDGAITDSKIDLGTISTNKLNSSRHMLF